MIFFGSFWGPGLLIAIGIVLILKHAFNLKFSAGRVIFGLVIIFIGLSMMFNSRGGIVDKRNIIFSNQEIRVTEPEDEYNIIFSNGTIDLSDVSPKNANRVKISSIFSNGTVRINRDTPVVITMHSAFGSIDAPDGSEISFGDHTFRTEAAQEEKARIEIDASAVFGKLEIVED